jgi:hypothetical protein
MSDGYTGLIGTIVGALITGGFAWFSDWRKNRAKNQKDLEVLALKLSYKLELYVAQCLECSEDDGLEYYVEDDGGIWYLFQRLHHGISRIYFRKI